MLILPFDGLASDVRAIDDGHCCAVRVCNPEYAVRLLFGLHSSDRESAPSVVIAGRRAQEALESLSAKIPFDAERLESWSVLRFDPPLRGKAARNSPFSEDLLEAFAEPSDLVILSLIEDFPALKARDISLTLKAFAAAARQGSHSVLLLFVGGPEQTAFERHMLDCRHLDGMACLGERQWHAFYWRSGLRISGEYRRAVSPKADMPGFIVEPSADSNGCSDDEGRIICAHPPMASQKPAMPSLEMAKDNEALFAEGMKASSAALLFTVRSHEESERVARWIYELRSTRGPDLKIFAAFASPAIRRFRIALLHLCGANLVFDHAASPAYIRIVMSHLARERFTRIIPDSFERIEAILSVPRPLGEVGSELFFKTVASCIASAADAQASCGALLVMKPAGGLKPAEAAAAFHPGRSGDICCVIGRHLAAFLSDCTPEHLPLVLSRIFSAPSDQIFESIVEMYENRLILDALVDLQAGVMPSSGIKRRVHAGMLPSEKAGSQLNRGPGIPAVKPRRIRLNEVAR